MITALAIMRLNTMPVEFCDTMHPPLDRTSESQNYLRELHLVPDLNVQLHHNPIAIIGMGAIMPQAHNLREFGNNIVGKVNCITDVPPSRWKFDDY